MSAEALVSRAAGLVSGARRVGYRDGFDSGPFMEYVYANQPSGVTPLGRALDRRFLNRPTCVAFRDIRTLAEQAVVEAIDAHTGQHPAVVADLAAGPATYLIAAMAARPDVRGVFGDVDPAALAQASAAAATARVADRVSISPGSAFDRERLAALDPRPDIVLELGLYGMFPDDDLIARHFRDLAELVAPTQIVANVQCDNPEIDHISRVWPSRSGGYCAWRLRPVEQILGYAAAAGYDPASITADRHGIYRVMRLVRR